MAFIVMVGTKGIATVISMATITGKGEEHIILLIITNPTATAVGLGQVFHLAAQTTSGFVSLDFENLYLGLFDFWRSLGHVNLFFDELSD